MKVSAGNLTQTSDGDPVEVVWQALERAGCEPHGPPHKFRAKCPSHDCNNSNSLSVQEGSDRRALLWCFAMGCQPDSITEAIGLTISDLFPAGHHKARRVRVPSVQREALTGNVKTVANVVASLDKIGGGWQATITCDCPFCGDVGGWLIVKAGREPYYDCPNNCAADEFLQALAWKAGRQ